MSAYDGIAVSDSLQVLLVNFAGAGHVFGSRRPVPLAVEFARVRLCAALGVSIAVKMP